MTNLNATDEENFVIVPATDRVNVANANPAEAADNAETSDSDSVVILNAGEEVQSFTITRCACYKCDQWRATQWAQFYLMLAWRTQPPQADYFRNRSLDFYERARRIGRQFEGISVRCSRIGRGDGAA